MTQRTSHSVTLPADLAAAIDGAVEAGDYASSDAAVEDAVKEWKERRENFGYTIAELKAEIQKGIDSGPSQPGEPFLDRLRRRYEEMAKAGAAAE